MNIFNIIEIICTIAAAVCLIVALVLVLRTEDTKCICREFIEQPDLGPCHCGRYEKVEL